MTVFDRQRVLVAEVERAFIGLGAVRELHLDAGFALSVGGSLRDGPRLAERMVLKPATLPPEPTAPSGPELEPFWMGEVVVGGDTGGGARDDKGRRQSAGLSPVDPSVR